MVVAYQVLLDFIKTRYRLHGTARCAHCYAVYCDKEAIPIIGLDEHVHCCSRPFVLYSIPEETTRVSGVYNLDSKLLVLGIEFL